MKRYPPQFVQLAEQAIKEVSGKKLYIGLPAAYRDNKNIFFIMKIEKEIITLHRLTKEGKSETQIKNISEVFRVDLFTNALARIMKKEKAILVKPGRAGGKFGIYYTETKSVFY